MNTDHDQPLDVLFEALVRVLDQDENGGGSDMEPDDPFWGPTPAERVLAHEERYWKINAPPEDRATLARCVSLATLAGAGEPGEADTLLQLLPGLQGDEAAERRNALITWLSGLYKGPLLHKPLRPDRLGEALVQAKMIRTGGRNHLEKILQAGTDRQTARAVTVLTRCAQQNNQTLDTVVKVLAATHHDLTVRAERSARGSGDRIGDATLASCLVATFTGLVGRAVTELENNTGYQRDLSVSLDRLGDLAVAVGDRARARQLYERSLAIRGVLVAGEPDNTGYQRDLSVSFNQLGDLAVAVGDRDRARQLYERSLAISEALVAGEPDNTGYQRDLSVSLDHLRNVDIGHD